MINAAGILFRAPTGRVLLMRRTDTGQWAFPGGHIEDGETPAVAAVREALEETGFLSGHAGVWHTRRVKNGVDFTTFLFDCEDEFKPKLNDEHDAYMWIAPFQALKESASRADDWEHSKHPRDKAGKFVSGIGSGAQPKSVNMTQVGPQTGSNPGGLYEHKGAGVKQYVKFYKNPAQAKTEALAGDILTQMGVGNTRPKFQITNGKESAAADWQSDLSPVNFDNLGPSQKEQLAGLFTAAVLTNNWDVVGLEYDNIAQNSDGDLVQMDLGGSFKFRAQGEPKSYDADPSNNFEGLLNKKFQSGKVFSKLFEDHPKLWGVALEALDKIKPEDVEWTFKNSGMADGQNLAKAFESRYYKLHDALASKNLATGGGEAPVKAKIGEPVPAGAPPPAQAAPEAPEAPKPAWETAKANAANTPAAQFEKVAALATPEFKAATQEYSKALSAASGVKEALDKMKALAPPGYFEAKAAATKAKKAEKAAAKLAKEAAKAPPPPTPPPPTPAPAVAAPSPATGAGQSVTQLMGTLNLATQKSYVEALQKDAADKVEAVLNAESSYEHNKNPEAYKPKLEAAKAAIQKYTESVPTYSANLDKANTLASPPTHLQQFVNQNSAYATALTDFLNSKDAIAHAAANAPGQLPNAKQEALNAKQKLQTVHNAIKAGPSAVATAAAPGVFGKSTMGGNYPGFNHYKAPKEHKTLGKSMKQRSLSTVEQKAVTSYKGSGYDAVNSQLRSGKPLSSQQALASVVLDSVCRAGTIPANTVLWRGVKDWKEMGWTNPLALAQQGKFQMDNGFISTSSSPSFAGGWTKYGSNPIVMEMKIHKETPGCHVGEAKGPTYDDGEQEIILPRGTIWKTVGHRKEALYPGHVTDVVTLELVSAEDIKASDIEY